MKRFIYTAVALIICASVFGIADYLNAKKKGTLVNYSEEEQQAKIVEKKTEIIITPQKNEGAALNSGKEIKKEIKKLQKKNGVAGNRIHSKIEIVKKIKEPMPVSLTDIELIPSITNMQVYPDSILPKEKRRKIDLEMFSRAPIREKKVKKN